MRQALRIVPLYTAIALVAIAANLAAQALAMAAYHGPHAVPASMAAGIATTLPVRYAVEKRYIFRFRAASVAHDGVLFVAYGAFGALTTALFLAVEYAFHLAFGSDAMRYLGGAVGLAAGHAAKYWLDRRFVFVAGEVTCTPAP